MEDDVEVEAVQFSESCTVWFIKGTDIAHRKDGPAKVWIIQGFEEWWFNGCIHREDGPAIISKHDPRKYWLHGVEYGNNIYAWGEAVLLLHNKPSTQEDVEEFVRSILQKQTKDLL